MDTNNVWTAAYDQRQHLKYRLNDVQTQRKEKARQLFGLTDMDAPETFAEMQDRIAKGLYVVSESNENGRYGPLHGVHWRDPAVKEDRAGYDAWKKIDAPKFQVVRDDIAIKDPKDALESLRAYEASAIQ